MAILVALAPETLNTRIDYDTTMLHLAVVTRSVKLCRLLVTKDANTTLAGDNGDTPVYLATNCHRIHVVNALVREPMSQEMLHPSYKVPCKTFLPGDFVGPDFLIHSCFRGDEGDPINVSLHSDWLVKWSWPICHEEEQVKSL